MNGPIGIVLPLSPSSICWIESWPSSWARKTSDMPAARIRLTTKPGTSPTTIGCFLVACANWYVVWTVSADVSSPSTISSSGITAAGKK